MKQKNVGMVIITLLLILAIVIIIIMGYNMYKISNDAQQRNKEIATLKEEKQEMQTTLDGIQNSLNSMNDLYNNQLNKNTNTDTNTEDSSEVKEEGVEEVAKNFVDAVNKKDWNTIEKYSNSQIVSTIKTYNISNLKISDDYEYNEHINAYTYSSMYDIEYEGLTSPKDVGLGGGIEIEKKDGKFIVSAAFVSGF